MNLNHDDTIVAIATPMGIGALLILRVSGQRAIPLVDSIFQGRKRLSQVPSHTIHYGKIYGQDGNLVDDVLVSIFRKPHSYTGEDSCEISTHGNPLIAQKIISRLLSLGTDVRLALPGEFTKRAFLNGRMDLAQAEAVVDVIEAASETALRGARNQLDGFLSNKVTKLRQELIEISAQIELGLDFAEEDIHFISEKQLQDKLQHLALEIDELLGSYHFGKLMRDGVQVPLVGRPNVGKSSLLNLLLKESRAIVSPIPGTTRDIIREDMNIHGVLFRLSDTAGIRSTQDFIEQEGVKRSQEAIRQADLVIFICEAPYGVDQDLYQELLTLTQAHRIITVMNKSDLVNLEQRQNMSQVATTAAQYITQCSHSSKSLATTMSSHPPTPTIAATSPQIALWISAKTGEGMDELCQLLYQLALGSKTYSEHSAVVSNLRHYQSLQHARQSLNQALAACQQNLSGEFIATDLRNAALQLAEIIGIVTSDDILHNIFSRFCIGK